MYITSYYGEKANVMAEAAVENTKKKEKKQK